MNRRERREAERENRRIDTLVRNGKPVHTPTRGGWNSTRDNIEFAAHFTRKRR